MMTPKSSTAVQAVISVLPVSGSISTSQIWEPAGQDLGEGRLVPLSMLMAACEDLDRTSGIDAHFGGFPESYAGPERACRPARGEPARLDIRRKADPPQLTVPRGIALALAKP